MMPQKMLLSLGLIVLGLVMGQSIRHLLNNGTIGPDTLVEKYIKTAQNLVLLVLAPIINVGTFWIVRITDMRFIALPLLGVAALTLGGLLALAFSRVFRHTRRQTGAMFTSGSFTNVGTIGGLVSYAFLGEAGYAFTSMYRMLEDFVYFGVGYPIAKMYSESARTGDGQPSFITRVLFDPFIRVYTLSMIAGTALNVSGYSRPHLFGTLNELLIPVTSVILVTTVGFRMRFGAVKGYLRESAAVGLIKFIVVPATIVPIAYLLGLGRLSDGTALKVVLILSSMPPAFMSLIPPQLYDLDVDLANSSWLVNTGALALVVPVLYILQSRL
jgi:hypothetical protein